MKRAILSLIISIFLSTTVFAMDAIQVIKNDHESIRQMISDLSSSMDSNKMDDSRENFKKLKDFLEKHETMEQKVWYPELEKKADLNSIIKHLKKEEADASRDLKKISAIKEDDKWMSAVKKLIKDVDHHAKEEEDKLLPKASEVLDQAELDRIGAKMENYKK